MVIGQFGPVGQAVMHHVQGEYGQDSEHVPTLFLSMVEKYVMEIRPKNSIAIQSHVLSMENGLLGQTGPTVQ